MQAVVELICALVASLAAAVFAQFGVDVHAGPVEHSRPPEVRRTNQRANDSTDLPRACDGRNRCALDRN